MKIILSNSRRGGKKWIFLCVFQVGQACKAELLIASLEKRESGVISRKGVSGHCWMNIWHHSQADLAHFHFIFLLFMTCPTFSVSLFVFLKNLLELSDERSSSLSQNPKYKSDVIKKNVTPHFINAIASLPDSMCWISWTTGSSLWSLSRSRYFILINNLTQHKKDLIGYYENKLLTWCNENLHNK